jgi:hypothetical protein
VGVSGEAALCDIGGEMDESPNDPARELDPGDEDFVALRAKGSRRRRVVFSGVALLVLLGGIGAAVSAQRTAKKELESSVDRLRACLLVGPLDAQETPALRFRRLQLHALTRSDAERVVGVDKAWPFKCRGNAGQVSDLGFSD